MRVQAFAMAAAAVVVPALGYVPVLVAVASVAVLAESCVVVEPGRVDLGEAQRGPERLGDPPGPAYVDGVKHNLHVVLSFALLVSEGRSTACGPPAAPCPVDVGDLGYCGALSREAAREPGRYVLR